MDLIFSENPESQKCIVTCHLARSKFEAHSEEWTSSKREPGWEWTWPTLVTEPGKSGVSANNRASKVWRYVWVTVPVSRKGHFRERSTLDLGDSDLWSHSPLRFLFRNEGKRLLKPLEEYSCLCQNCFSANRQNLSKSWKGLDLWCEDVPGNMWCPTEIGLKRKYFN